jgi:sporulation protein YlmC with PRC-barrel domain
MKLVKDAKIFTIDGKEAGNLNRFVMDPRSKAVTHIVFEHGGLFSQVEYLLPIELVNRVDDDGIHMMDLPVESVEDLPRFEQDRYIITNERTLIDEGVISDQSVRGYYYYPGSPFGNTGMMRPGDSMHVYNPPEGTPGISQGGIAESGQTPVRKETETNIPDETVALKEGAKVVSSDHKHVGDVERLLMDPDSEKATHFLITKGLFTKEKKLIPMDWVGDIREDEVLLVLEEDVVDRLPEFKDRED